MFLFFKYCSFFVFYVHKLLYKFIKMKKVQVNKIREHLAKYLAEAEQGEEIVITRHSKPVARLISVDQKKPVFPDLNEFRKKIEVKGKPMSDVIAEMRKQERH